MGKPSQSTFAAILFTAASSGCGQEDLEGEYWQVDVAGTENGCTGGGANYTESYEYRVVYDGNDIILAIGEDIWATGTAEGCTLNYSSLVWSDYREDYEIEWEILGTSQVNVGGGGGCVDGSDWAGTETFVVATSEHPDVQPGCTYTLDVTGTFLKTVE
jgi:hypothetical protein